MLRKCIVCGSRYELRVANKGVYLYADVCSKECFIEVLKSMKSMWTWKKIEEVAKKNEWTIQERMDFKDFRSGPELGFYNWCKENKIAVEYEKYGFVHRKLYDRDLGHYKKPYLPDFYLPDFCTFIEIKLDKWEKSSYPKARLFASVFPLLAVDYQIMKIIGAKHDRIRKYDLLKERKFVV